MIRAGQRVEFERFSQKTTGTIIRTQWYGWATGASEYTILEDGSSDLVGMSWYGLPHVGQEDLQAAKTRYIAKLQEYPKWAEQIAAGIDPTETWGDWDGFRRREGN